MVRLAIVADTPQGDSLAALVPRIAGAEVVLREATLEQLVAGGMADVDAVVLLSKESPDVCQQVVDAGKHLLVSLNSQFSTEAIQALSDQCQQQKVCLMVAGSDRLRPALQARWPSLAAGELGEPGLVRLHRWSSTGTNGAGLPDDLLRDLDLVLNVFESLPSEVYAITRSVIGAEEPDYIQIHLGFDGGGMAVIDRAATLPPGDGYFSFSVIGSAGAVYADDHLNKQLVFRGQHPVAVGTESEDLAAVADLQEFCQAIEQQRVARISGADWLAAVKTAEMVRESIGACSAVRVGEGGAS